MAFASFRKFTLEVNFLIAIVFYIQAIVVSSSWYTFDMKNIVISALYLIVLLCLSAFVFDPSYLYYELPWLDIPMHVMGGFGVASLTGAILSYKKQTISYWKLFVVYSIVAISWELYEYVNDIMAIAGWNGWTDTSSDFINGAIGASIAYLFVRK